GRADDANGAAAAIEREAARHLVEVSDSDDATAGALRHLPERPKRTAHIRVLVDVGARGQERHERIENDQLRAGSPDALLKTSNILRYQERSLIPPGLHGWGD